ncbi:MAG: class I SAM-dependent methyltransferase [Desulfobacteraceae bacterium]|nr:class I SAM-dependent methyltransferase [Desulfobacteraceae bacterium]
MENMDRHQENWDAYYKSNPEKFDDPWLEKYVHLFDPFPAPVILDLGCGNGNNLPFLIKCSATVYACDYSKEAIHLVSSEFPIVKTSVLDMRTPLPFASEKFEVIVSDLSLHYYSKAMTERIFQELARILKQNGLLFVRVNSVLDVLHGFGKGDELEPHYFVSDGRHKRFFDSDDIDDYFGKAFRIEVKEEKKSNRSSREKILWEIVLRKKV